MVRKNIFLILLVGLLTIPQVIGMSQHSDPISMDLNSEFIGFPGVDIPTANSMLNCQDSVYEYMGCDSSMDHLPVGGNYKGRMLVIDSGISNEGIYNLEHNFDIDIVEYYSYVGYSARDSQTLNQFSVDIGYGSHR